MLNLCVLDSITLIDVFNWTRYLALFGSKQFDFIYNKIRYLIGLKIGITYVIFHIHAKIKIDSYDYLPLEKTMTSHNVIILVKSVFSRDKHKNFNTIIYS